MSKQLRMNIALLIITIIWGSSFALMKNVLDGMPAFSYLAIRFVLAAVVLLLYNRKKLRLLNRKNILYGSLIGFMLFGSLAFQVNGLYYTTASNSAFITQLGVIFVPLVSALFLRRKPDRFSIFGVVFAFIGLFFIFDGIHLNLNLGDFLTFVCAVFVAFQIILIDRFTEYSDPDLLAVVQICFSAFLGVILWGGLGAEPIIFNVDVIITILVTGILGTAVAYTVQTKAQKYTSPTHVALIFTLEPVFGLLFAMIIKNSSGVAEVAGIGKLFGCILIIVGVLLSQYKLIKKN